MDAIEDRAVIVGVLASHDLACPSCKYNLRGLTGVNCPECNQRLVLRIGLAEPRVGWLIAGVTGLAAGLGFCGLLIVYWVAMEMMRGGGRPAHGLIPLVGGAVVCSIGLLMWVRKRGAIARAPRGVRLALLAGAWAAGVGFPIWFMMVIR